MAIKTSARTFQSKHKLNLIRCSLSVHAVFSCLDTKQQNNRIGGLYASPRTREETAIHHVCKPLASYKVTKVRASESKHKCIKHLRLRTSRRWGNAWLSLDLLLCCHTSGGACASQECLSLSCWFMLMQLSCSLNKCFCVSWAIVLSTILYIYKMETFPVMTSILLWEGLEGYNGSLCSLCLPWDNYDND